MDKRYQTGTVKVEKNTSAKDTWQRGTPDRGIKSHSCEQFAAAEKHKRETACRVLGISNRWF